MDEGWMGSVLEVGENGKCKWDECDFGGSRMNPDWNRLSKGLHTIPCRVSNFLPGNNSSTFHLKFPFRFLPRLISMPTKSTSTVRPTHTLMRCCQRPFPFPFKSLFHFVIRIHSRRGHTTWHSLWLKLSWTLIQISVFHSKIILVVNFN